MTLRSSIVVCSLVLACSSPAPDETSAGSGAGTMGGGQANAGAANAGTANSGGTTTNGGASGSGGATAGNSGTGGGASGGSGMAGTGAVESDFCPVGTPCPVMPLGDSITAGAGSSGGGYRVRLFSRALADGKSLTFVGTQFEGPDLVEGVTFPKQHEGHPGYTIDGAMGILPLVAGALEASQPKVVLLMAGANDVNGWIDLEHAPDRLGQLIDAVVAFDPELLVVVAQITPTTDDDKNTRVQAFNAGVPAVVATRVAAGKHVILVDMYSAITQNPSYKVEYMADFIHPNDAGHMAMGDVWYSALEPYLH